MPELGAHNVVVETSAGRGLTSASRQPADMVLSDFAVSDPVEIILRLRTTFWSGQRIAFVDDNETILELILDNYDMRFGEYARKRSTTGWKRGEEQNEIKVTLDGKHARLFVNGKFFGLQDVKFRKINQIKILGLKRDMDFLYAVSVGPLP